MNDIVIDFNPRPKITINTLEDTNIKKCLLSYNIIDSNKNNIYSTHLSEGNWFYHHIEFYCNWQIELQKWDPKDGFITLYTHRYNDTGKNVRFNFDTDSGFDVHEWTKVVIEYKKVHKCNVFISINDLRLKNKIGKFKDIRIISSDEMVSDCYATYNIGRYNIKKYGIDLGISTYNPFNEIDFLNGLGLKIPGGNTIASCRNPRYWENLSSREIAEDILGLSKDWNFI